MQTTCTQVYSGLDGVAGGLVVGAQLVEEALHADSVMRALGLLDILDHLVDDFPALARRVLIALADKLGLVLEVLGMVLFLDAGVFGVKGLQIDLCLFQGLLALGLGAGIALLDFALKLFLPGPTESEIGQTVSSS